MTLGSRLFNFAVRFDRLRRAQWLWKTVPYRFVAVSETTPCPACCREAAQFESDYPSRVEPFASKSVRYCGRCGMGFVEGMAPVLAEYYQSDYAIENRGDRDVSCGAYFEQIESSDELRFRTYRKRALRQISLLKTHGARFDTVLDYGSGPGVFLHLASWRLSHAVEPDTHSHKFLKHLDAAIHTNLATVPSGQFDTIVASHALEHLPSENLVKTLRSLLETLSDDGLMLIEVPQGGHSYLNLSGARQDPHTLFFTGRALVEAISQAGGTVVFQRAAGKIESPLRKDAVFTPSGPPFFKTRRGSLTVICSR